VARLIIQRDGMDERRVELGERDLRIGRAAENDLVLEDPEKGVSRVHAEVRCEQGRYALIDLNSQNGLWLGDRRVSRVDLGPGVAVTIGPYHLILEATAGDRGAAPGEALDATMGLTATAVVPVDQPPVAAGAPAGGGPPTGQTRAAGPKTDPVAWLARQPKAYVFGGFAIIAVLVIALASVLKPGPAPPAGKSAPAAGKPAPAAGAATVPAPTSANEKTVADLLEGARSMLSGGDLEGAREQVEQALVVIPSHPAALDLRMKIEAERQRRAAQRPTGGGASGAPEERPKAEGDEGIQLEWELASLEDAVRRLRAAAAQDAPQLERQIQALDDSIRRARARMKADADDAYQRARQRDQAGRPAEAIVLYEQALRFWPPDEPNRRTARERLHALRGGR
jgi:hypothetical protein